MKTQTILRAVAVAAAVLLLPTSASALVSVGVDIGAMDTESFSTGVESGLRIELGGDNLGVLFRIGHADGFDEFEPKNKDTHGDAWRHHRHADEFSIIPLEVGLVLRTPSIAGFRFYGGAGVGYYFIDFEDNEWYGDTHDDVDDVFGWWALGGVEFGVAPVEFFLEAKYTGASEKEDVYFRDHISRLEQREKVDVDLSGVSVLAGVRIWF